VVNAMLHAHIQFAQHAIYEHRYLYNHVYPNHLPLSPFFWKF